MAEELYEQFEGIAERLEALRDYTTGRVNKFKVARAAKELREVCYNLAHIRTLYERAQKSREWLQNLPHDGTCAFSNRHPADCDCYVQMAVEAANTIGALLNARITESQREDDNHGESEETEETT